VDGTNVIMHKDINLGIATALKDGNLIVPVIKNADQLNLRGLVHIVNDLSDRARNNKLQVDEVRQGTFTITNVGAFGCLTGTPIIYQPQVAILAIGSIMKKPAIIESEYGDVIAIRQILMLSLSFDHRVIDGALACSFLKRVATYMERFDTNQVI